MIGVLFYIVVGLWCMAGWYVCRWLITRRTQVLSRRLLFVPLFWVVWLIGPVADDIVGRRMFEEECARLPPVRFFGPVHIGAGVFFDESGKRRWKSEQEFARIAVETHELQRLFKWKDQRTQIVAFPISITRTDAVLYHVTSNAPSLAMSSLSSNGGWIERVVARLYPYVWACRSPGRGPRDEERIIF